MPLKKPRSAPLPAPFKDIAASGDEEKIMAARIIKRELDQAGGFSWSDRPQRARGPMGALRAVPTHQKWFALASLGMGGIIIMGFIVAGNTGYVKPELGPIYFDSWGADRTSEDALKDKEERMVELKAAYAAHNQRIDDAQAAQARQDDAQAAAKAAQVTAQQQQEARSAAEQQAAARQEGLEAERRAAQGATSE